MTSAETNSSHEQHPTSLGKSISEDELSEVLRGIHAENLASYEELLQQPPESNLSLFWDIVVVTAGDAQQQHCYESRINQKLELGLIPSCARYHVIADPPRSNIGSGGSTCFVMKTLLEQYSAEFLSTARVLLIHAGGYSSRLPHVSTRGKVFMTLPQANSPQGIQILELKLVLYLHLLRTMPPGVFLTSADGIELFASKSPFPSVAKPRTITALAHPSSMHIGSTHGVYLLQDPEGLVAADRELRPKDQSALLLNCQQFLHKPSLEIKQNAVYTDSCYYFDPETAIILANIYPTLHPECDLEAWADILFFQDSDSGSGSSQDSDAISSDPHHQGRQIMKRVLQETGISLDVMVLNASKFYHLGTMQEFLTGVCTDTAFMSELHIHNVVRGIAKVQGAAVFATTSPAPATKIVENVDHSTNIINSPVYIENSSVPLAGSIHPNTIIVDTDLPNGAIIPNGTCIFTLQLQADQFVTFTFSIKDNMKKTTHFTFSDNGIDALKRLAIFEHVPVSAMLTREADPPLGCVGDLSLWTAPVFEIAATKVDSVRMALDRLYRIRKFQQDKEIGVGQPLPTRTETSAPRVMGWVSMKDAARIARELEL
ncbi:hypothetical protein BG011_004901 [Mortierella polycephala]|uniref:GDP-fucose pyrophosphorylase domain-containing protein n=1 Tax=Mortierella polycephala TaxID=41804 RepID=A0A9P6QC65_9FUNG|nr:hypothetical protein BG011_004901 [Mortierella polycephala]